MSDYYDLDRPYGINDWNNLVNAVNGILQDPPEGDEACEPIDTIDTVSDPHIWKVSDVQEVRDKLIETCPEISFSEPLEIWKPGIIDEIESAMDQAWCDCCDDEWLHDEQGTDINLFTYPPEMSSNCFGYPDGVPIPLSGVIDGMSIAKPGIKNRRWTIWSSVVGGDISCEGEVRYSGSQYYPTTWGIYVFCGICNDFCQSVIDDNEEDLVGWGDLIWTMRITTASAQCADCDEE
jgi:hypothetical protein